MIEFMKIKDIKINKTAALAPMASVADKAYRLMCKKFGAAYVVGEMASAKGLCYSDKKTAELLTSTEEEKPMAIQLFGSEPDFMAKACEIASAYNPQIIDINMGCPVPKVIKTGSGSALMKTPELAYDVIKACVNATDIPITVKIRKGFFEDNINAVEFAIMAESAGASAITVHGRTQKQMYAPPVDIEIIKQVKAAVKVPVIGNGDVTSVETAKYMYDYTGCDLVMIGRGSYGRPWIFEEIEHYFATGELIKPKSVEEKIEVMLEHISLICTYEGEKNGMKQSRKHASYYLKGMPNAAHLRHMCSSLETYEDIKKVANIILSDKNMYEK